jgi:ribosomal-protein-alanine N-acetyltransferase
LEVNLRKVKKEDQNHLKVISDDCFPNKEVHLLVESFLDMEHFYVAEELEYGMLLGFIIFRINPKKTIHIMVLAVRPKFQRQGIGSIFMEKVDQIVRSNGIEAVRLEVQIDNKYAIEFYERKGFEIVKTVECYYEDGSDAFVMIKRCK